MNRLKRSIVTGTIALLFSQGTNGQPEQQFEVAVIRPDLSGANAGTSFEVPEGGRLRITNEPLKLLIRAAFGIQNAQIAGGPAWIETDRFDIEAKTGDGKKIDQEQLKPILQNLLADRFKLKFHHETREITVYAITADNKIQPKLKVKTEGEPSAMNTHTLPGKSQVVATGASMDLFAGYVGNRLGRIVVDKTGLKETYDFTLEWAPDQSPDSSAPSLVTALREQLGLRLESQKSPVDILVIDSVDKPTEN
jgi:uncharacterized protein (TIGR03435 family)